MAEIYSLLIIDDEPEFLELARLALEVADFTVLKAENGPEGLKLAKKKKPTVILLDVTMPEMNGLEVLDKLKKNSKTKNIPVIMLTGKSMMEDVERAFDAGAIGYITKPIEFCDLAKKVRAKIEKHDE